MNKGDKMLEKQAVASRDEINARFDIIDPSFWRAVAKIAAIGAKKYGEYNWKKSRMKGNASPVNHILDHLTSYAIREPYDHTEIGGNERKYHLAAIAFNAMMEFWYEEHEKWPTDTEKTQSQIDVTGAGK